MLSSVDGMCDVYIYVYMCSHVCVCARARAYVRGMRVRGQVPGSVSSCVAGRVRRFGRREISVNIKHGRRTESVQRQRSERQLDE